MSAAATVRAIKVDVGCRRRHSRAAAALGLLLPFWVPGSAAAVSFGMTSSIGMMQPGICCPVGVAAGTTLLSFCSAYQAPVTGCLSSWSIYMGDTGGGCGSSGSCAMTFQVWTVAGSTFTCIYQDPIPRVPPAATLSTYALSPPPIIPAGAYIAVTICDGIKILWISSGSCGSPTGPACATRFGASPGCPPAGVPFPLQFSNSILAISANIVGFTCTATPTPFGSITSTPTATTAPTYALPYCDSFDGQHPQSDWELVPVLGGTNSWVYGAPFTANGAPTAFSAPNCIGTNANAGQYFSLEESAATSPRLTMPANGALLTWRQWYSIEPGYDGGKIEVTTDNGITWTVVVPTTGYPTAMVSDTTCFPGSNSYSGTANTWTQRTVDLTPFVNQTLRFRFRFCADFGLTFPGWYIDDVCVAVPGTPTTTGTPTSTATGTRTGSATWTVTVSGTATVTRTATSTASESATRSATATESGTATETATATESGTETESATDTETGIYSVTSTATASETETALPSDTPTPCETPTDTATPTVAPTETWTATESATMSASATRSATVTVTSNPASPTATRQPFHAYPNPARRYQSIRFQGLSPGETVSLYNVRGEKVALLRADGRGVAAWAAPADGSRSRGAYTYLTAGASPRRRGIVAILE